MRAGVRVGRVVLDLEDLAFALGIVCDHELDRVQHTHRALGIGVEILAQAMLKEPVLDGARSLGNADALAEIADGKRREAAAAETAQRRHARIIPAGDIVLLHKLAQLALGHDGIVDAKARKLDLARLMVRNGNIVHDPVVERAVLLILQRAQRVRDALQRVLNGVGKIVHRENAPLRALTVMVDIADTVEHRVAHIEIAGGKVDLGAQRAAALGELAVFHALKEVEVFLDAPVTIRRNGGLADIAAVLLKLLGRQVTDISKTFFDQLHRILVVFFKIITAVIEAVAPVEAEPVDILLDGVDVFGILLGGVRVVHAQIADTAELFSRTEVDDQRLAMTDVKIAVGLRRKTGMHLLALKLTARRDILLDKRMDKVFDLRLSPLGDRAFGFLCHGSSSVRRSLHGNAAKKS